MKRQHIVALVALLALPFFVPGAGADDAPPSPAQGAEADEKYTAEELAEIVGPIALYPDSLLASLLPASTQPLDVIQASRWVAGQEGEIGEIPASMGWDDNVKALIQFPDVLTWMSENVDWMEELGYAIAVQQEDVLAAIQEFRAKTQEAGNLESNDKQVVTVEEDSIEIQPAEPTVIYVPQYDPVYVTQPAYKYPFWQGVAAGVVGVWAINTIRWGGRWGRGHGSINVNKSATFNFSRSGTVNRVSGGSRWGAARPRGARGRPATRPNRGRATARPKVPNYNRPGKRARPAKGGVKPGKAGTPRKRPSKSRPGGSRPGKSPGGATRPGKTPGATRPGKSPGGARTRPAKSAPKKSAPKKSAFSGSSRSGSSARKSSDRGRSSRSSSARSSGRSAGGGGGGRSRGGGGGRRR